MENCLLIVDSNERFEDADYDYSEFCDDNGWIYLECWYANNIGVIYNNKIVFSSEEISSFCREKHVTDNDSDDEHVVSKFCKDNPYCSWYYFYCAPCTDDWSKTDFDDLSNKVLVKQNGFTLHKDNKDYKIGHMGAHVHLYIAHV